jgi:hypothetical protein
MEAIMPNGPNTLQMPRHLAERLQEARRYADRSKEARTFAALVQRGVPWSSVMPQRLFAIAEAHSIGVEYERFFALMLTGFHGPRGTLHTIDFMRRLVAAAIAVAKGDEAPMLYGEGVYIFGGDEDDTWSAPRYRDSVALSPQLFTTGIAYPSLVPSPPPPVAPAPDIATPPAAATPAAPGPTRPLSRPATPSYHTRTRPLSS